MLRDRYLTALKNGGIPFTLAASVAQRKPTWQLPPHPAWKSHASIILKLGLQDDLDNIHPTANETPN